MDKKKLEKLVVRIDNGEELFKTELIEVADHFFSLAVRLHYYNHETGVQCFCCDKYLTPKIAQAGHFIPRNYYQLRYDFDNARVQCVKCNVMEKEMGKLVMCRRLPQELVDSLFRRASKLPLTVAKLHTYIKRYRKMSDDLFREKGVTPW